MKKAKAKESRKIFVHLPAYREPELVPTIKDCLQQAKNPKRIHFGICRQFKPEDGFDNVDEFRNDKRFKIVDIPHEQAKGLPYARARINELITTEDYILQLDSHHRFVENWDEILIDMHDGLEKKKFKPILTGYLPYYSPFNDPAGRCLEPWQQQFACFYPHGTIFIRPGLLQGWQTRTEPMRSRFISGHFAFARAEWGKEIKHDPDIYFSGEELNLTVRSFTHGYDLFHPHKIVIWHATMREERAGKLVWDDQHKRGENWYAAQQKAWKKIRVMLGTEKDDEVKKTLKGYDVGTVRTIRDFEKYAGFNFARKGVQKYTLENNEPPNPVIKNEAEWERSFSTSFYHLVTFDKNVFKEKDYQFLLCAFDDEKGEAIYREDLNEQQFKEVLARPDQFVSMERFFLTEKKPARWVLWACSKSKGWCERIEHILK